MLYRVKTAFTFLLTFLIISCHTKSDKKVSSCDLCKSIVETFEKRMEDTENKTYDSGSYEWVKKNLGKYEGSEMRFISIMENICSQSTDKSKCLSFIEKHESAIENWFFESRKQNITLVEHLCIESAKVCCPPTTFGKNCEPCHGLVDGVMCSQRGSCSGDGTRKGNGSCECTRGYGGEFCTECDTAFYMKEEDNSCLPCHNSCTGPCVNHTLEGCLGKCKEGWKLDEENKCQDVDECSLNTFDCKEGQRCVNVPGKYYCMDCHVNCQTCNGDGEDKCLTCKPGFEKDENNKCVDIDECAKNQVECKPMTYCLNRQGDYKCKKCHKGCKDGCSGPDLDDCTSCKEGFIKSETGTGCVDVDECNENKNLCSAGKYCVNKEGSYKCKKCDESCSICNGPGPHSCLACFEGYNMVKGLCTDVSKIKQTESAEDEDDL